MEECTEDFTHLLGPSAGEEFASDRNVIENGEMVLMCHTLTSRMMEEWVKRVRERANNFDIDWGFSGGKASVHALGDIKAVRRAMLAEYPVFRKMYHTAMDETGMNETAREKERTDRMVESFFSGVRYFVENEDA